MSTPSDFDKDAGAEILVKKVFILTMATAAIYIGTVAVFVL